MKASDKSRQPGKTEKAPKEEKIEPDNTPEEENTEPDNTLNLIPTKLFLKKLEEELKGELLPRNIFLAFQRIAPRVDTEENYRKLWETTFKRQ